MSERAGGEEEGGTTMSKLPCLWGFGPKYRNHAYNKLVDREEPRRHPLVDRKADHGRGRGWAQVRGQSRLWCQIEAAQADRVTRGWNLQHLGRGAGRGPGELKCHSTVGPDLQPDAPDRVDSRLEPDRVDPRLCGGAQ